MCHSGEGCWWCRRLWEGRGEVYGNSLFFMFNFAIELITTALKNEVYLLIRGEKQFLPSKNFICSATVTQAFFFYTVTVHCSVSLCFICISYKQHMVGFWILSSLRSSFFNEECWTIYIYCYYRYMWISLFWVFYLPRFFYSSFSIFHLFGRYTSYFYYFSRKT